MKKKGLQRILSIALAITMTAGQTLNLPALAEEEEIPAEEIAEELPEEEQEEKIVEEETEEELTETEEPAVSEEEIIEEAEEEEPVIEETGPAEETKKEIPGQEEEAAEEEEPEETETPELSEEEPAEEFADEPYFYVAGKSIPVEGTGVLTVESEFITSGTVTYEYETNTLTLDNAVIVNDPAETQLDSPGTKSICKTGTEGLTIKLVGENSITVTSERTDIYRIRGIETGGLLTITSDDGTGSLDLNVLNDSENWYPEAIAVYGSKVSIENCTLDVTGTNYSFYIRDELHFGAGANVTAVSTKYWAVNNFSDGVKVTHSPLECDMYGYENADDEEGNSLYEPEYVYDYYSWKPFEKYHKVTVTDRKPAGNVLLSGNCGAEGDNVTFTLTDKGLLTISGTGAMADFDTLDYNTETNPPWYNSQIILAASVVIEEGVTHIGNHSFINCELLTDVSFPDTLESIGNYAFCNCDILPEIVFPSSLKTIGEYAFEDCRALEELVIPEGTETIRHGAFSDCKNLRQITLPDTLTYLGDYAFADCTKLRSIELPANLAYFGSGVFSYCESLPGPVTIPAGITELKESVFRYCRNLESVILPEGLTSIGYETFERCEKLTQIELPSTLTSIGEEAFEASGLTSIDIPNSVATIVHEAFCNCKSLVSVHLPDSLTVIQEETFEGCTSLKTVNLPEGLTSIGYDAFASCALEEVVIPDSVTSWDYRSFINNTSLRKVTTGSGVDQIPSYAFQGCTALTDVTISDTITTIADQAFASCTNLETIYIPDSVIYLYTSVFNGCTSLKNVRLSPNITYLSSGVFYNCSELEEIELPSGLKTFGDNLFTGCSKLKSLTIPETVNSIGTGAFKDCTALAELNIPASLNQNTIGASTFENCTSLKEITIPDKTKGIDNYAFRNCTSLETIHFNGVLENSIYYSSYAVGSYAFSGCTSLESLSLTFRGKDAAIYDYAFMNLPADLVQVYGIPGGALESNAASRNYTFHPAGFTIRYLPNGAEGEMEEQVIDYTEFTAESEPYRFMPNAFTYGDLMFLNWNTKEDGSGKSYADQAEVPIDVPSSGVLTLYAQWAEGYDLWIKGQLIHSKNKDDIYLALNGYSNPSYPVTYDPDTNTLTIGTGFYVTNYNSVKEGAGPEYYSGLYYAGDRELTIEVKRSAQFNGAGGLGIPDICGLYCAGSLRIVFNKDENTSGDIRLEVGNNNSSTNMTGMYVGGNLTISGNGDFYARSNYGGEGHSYALRMGGGILRLQDRIRAYLIPGYGEAGAYGLYLDGNTTLRALNWTSVLDINGNNGFGAVGGAEGVTLSHRISEIDLAGYSTATFSGDMTPLTETSYPVSSLAQYPGIRAKRINHAMTAALADPNRNYVYTGSAIKPEIIVVCAGNTLYEGKDYTVKYKNNTKAYVLPEGVEKDQEGFMELTARQRKSVPQIIITGKGNFTGSTTLYFEIGKKSIVPGDTADGTVPVKAADLTIVSGSKASPILYYGTNKLTAKDFTTDPAASVKYRESTVMTVTGKGNYTGTVEVPVTVVPTKADLKNIAVDFGPKSIVFDGTDRKEEILAGIRVYDALDKTEKADIGQEHYSLTMSGNTKEAGTVKVTVTGVNGYSGTKTASIRIVPNKDIDIYVINEYPEGQTYSGYARTGFLSVYADVDGEGEGDDKYETRLVEGKDFKVTYKNNINVTTAKKKASYTVSFIGSYKGKKAVSGKFDIFPKKIQNAYIEMIPDKVYTKPGAYASAPLVTYNGFTLKAGKDYTVSYYRKVDGHYDEEGRYIYDLIGPITSKKGQMITDADFVDENGNERNQIYVYAVMRGKGNFASGDSNDINWRSYMIRKQQPSETVRYLDMSKATVTITRMNAKGKAVKVSSFPFTGNSITFDPNGSGSSDYSADIRITYKYDKKTTLTLEYNRDFYLSYYDNVNKGTATVVVRGRNNTRMFYDQNGEPVRDMKGNEIGYIGFTGAKSTKYKITSGKIANLLKLILGS